MHLRRLNEVQKLIMLHLYELRTTPMVPPDPRLSKNEIAKTFDVNTEDLLKELKELMKRAYIRPFKIGKDECYMITKYGIDEIEKQQERLLELGTGGIKIKIRKKSKPVQRMC